MSVWDQTEHEVWGYLIGNRWHPTVDERSARNLVDNNSTRRLAKRILSAVEEVKEPKAGR